MRDEFARCVVHARRGVADLTPGPQAFAFRAQTAADHGLEVIQFQVHVHQPGIFRQAHEPGPERRRIDQGREHAAMHDAEGLQVFLAEIELDAAAVELDRRDGHADQVRVRRLFHAVAQGLDIGRIGSHRPYCDSSNGKRLTRKRARRGQSRPMPRSPVDDFAGAFNRPCRPACKLASCHRSRSSFRPGAPRTRRPRDRTCCRWPKAGKKAGPGRCRR